MELVIRISTDNDAFVGQTGREVARILRGYADRVETEYGQCVAHFCTSLRDFNGSSCGTAEVESNRVVRV